MSSQRSAEGSQVLLETVRRSWRLEQQQWKSLGPFRVLPCEILRLIMSHLTASSLVQLGQVSKGWQLLMREWMTLKSAAWHLAPVRRFPYDSSEFYDEYTHLGLLCRRVLDSRSPLPERAHAVWKLIERVETACVIRDHTRYTPGFLGAVNMFRAAVPLSCVPIGERFDTMWQILKDSIAVDTTLLRQEPGEDAVLETDLRLALRVLFLLPRNDVDRVCTPPREDRGKMLRSLMYRLGAPERARLLFICYGPRSGGVVEWTRPCDPVYTSLTQMVHVVAELGAAIKILARSSSQEYIYSLMQQLVETPSVWLPRYEIILLLLMGPQAAAAVLAGHAMKGGQRSELVSTRIGQMASFTQLFRQKVFSSQGVGQPLLNAATMDFRALFRHFFHLVPENLWPLNLIDNSVCVALSIAFTVGGELFASRVFDILYPIVDCHQMIVIV